MDKKDNWFEKYRKTKEYREKIWKERNKLCFDTRYRNKYRRDNIELRNNALAQLEKIEKLNAPNDYQLRKTKVLWEQILDLAGIFLEDCETAEYNHKTLQLKNCRYQLNKKRSGKGYLFEYSFLNSKSKQRTKYLIIKNEIVTQGFESFRVRDKWSKVGYKKVDEGSFLFKIKNFEEVQFNFHGKVKYDIKCKADRKVDDYEWILSFI